MTEIFLDSLKDCLRLLPFLFLTYILIEYTEHKMSNRTREWIYRAGKAGPILGSLAGLIPQCGFSAVAAGLFAAGVVSPGTLIAVFLSTSDEMLPVMISEHIGLTVILKILAVKAVTGTVIGFLTDFTAERLKHGKRENTRPPQWKYPYASDNIYPSRDPKSLCKHDHCNCEKRGILRSSLFHTAQVFVFIFLISLFLGFGMDWFSQSAFSRGIFTIPGLEEAIAALIGMIPNCAASVFITQLYFEKVIRSGALFAGLLCGAGTGLLVLFRENYNKKENLIITVVLYASGVLSGIVAGQCLKLL